jgi:hypothetical protein
LKETKKGAIDRVPTLGKGGISMQSVACKITPLKIILLILMVIGLYLALTPWTGGPYGVYKPMLFGWLPRFLWVSITGQLIIWISAAAWYKFVK